jgi:transposase
MKNSLKLANFHDQMLFVGIDTHLKSWKVSIYADQLELKTYAQQCNIEELVHNLKDTYPGARFVCAYEAGFSGFNVP